MFVHSAASAGASTTWVSKLAGETISNTSKSLGVNSSKLKNTTYFSASLLIGSIVSVSGIIGFVGLIVPHVCRLLWGPDNRIVIPTSFFVGAIYLLIADTVG